MLTLDFIQDINESWMDQPPPGKGGGFNKHGRYDDDQSSTSATEICVSLCSLYTEENTSSSSIRKIGEAAGETNSSSSSHPLLTKATSLKDKRQKLEAWNDKQKNNKETIIRRQKITPESIDNNNNERDRRASFSSTMTITAKSLLKKSTKATKAEDARTKRMIVRLVQTEIDLKEKLETLPATINQEKQQCGEGERGGRRRSLAVVREKAEMKLRLSQIEACRDFYQQRLAAENSTTSTPVPVEILKVISSLPKYQSITSSSSKQPKSLNDELNNFVRKLKEESPKEFSDILQEARRWRGTESQALELGSKGPDFNLRCHTGKLISSKALRQNHQRLIVVFYHSGESPMCRMNLIALEKLNKVYEREGAVLLGIGHESDTFKTAGVTGVSFPLLQDSQGFVARQFGITGREGAKPMPSSFVIDTNGEIIWKFVSADFTKRAEPMDILESLPLQAKKKGNFFKRLSLSK